jgi:hypothetical protein
VSPGCPQSKPKPGHIDDAALQGLERLRYGRSSASRENPEHLYPVCGELLIRTETISVAQTCESFTYRSAEDENSAQRPARASRARRRCPTANLSCRLPWEKTQVLCIQMVVDLAEPPRKLERRQPNARITISFHPWVATLAHGRIPD